MVTAAGVLTAVGAALSVQTHGSNTERRQPSGAAALDRVACQHRRSAKVLGFFALLPSILAMDCVLTRWADDIYTTPSGASTTAVFEVPPNHLGSAWPPGINEHRNQRPCARTGRKPQTSGGIQTTSKPTLTRKAAADDSTRNDLVCGKSGDRGHHGRGCPRVVPARAGGGCRAPGCIGLPGPKA